MALSLPDKASSPVNLYGATKLVSDKVLFQVISIPQTASHVLRSDMAMLCCRAVQLFRSFINGEMKTNSPITDAAMTRFMISLTQSVLDLVSHAFIDMVGGEIYVRKIPSMRVTDIAECINGQSKKL